MKPTPEQQAHSQRDQQRWFPVHLPIHVQRDQPVDVGAWPHHAEFQPRVKHLMNQPQVVNRKERHRQQAPHQQLADALGTLAGEMMHAGVRQERLLPPGAG
jgi:hypothetical protein